MLSKLENCDWLLLKPLLTGSAENPIVNIKPTIVKKISIEITTTLVIVYA